MPLVILLILAAVLAKYAWLIVAVIVVVGVSLAVGKNWVWHDDRVEARRKRRAEVAARADRQHAAVLRGDESGVYGEWPPVLM
jgi:type II secretory pathway pseudopilin PulG